MRSIFSVLLCLMAGLASADSVEIIGASAQAAGAGRYHIRVTLRHADSGWDHYANAWRVLAPNGRVLGERVLFHPHVDEQPFTRGLTVDVPAGIIEVEIEAQDSRHGISDQRHALTLPQ